MSDKVMFRSTITDMFDSLSDDALLVLGARLERFLDDYGKYRVSHNEFITSFDLDSIIPDLREFQIILKLYCCHDWSPHNDDLQA